MTKNAHSEQTYMFFPLAFFSQTHNRQVTFIHLFIHWNYPTGSDQIGCCRLSSECDFYQHCPLWHLLHMGLKPVSTKFLKNTQT
jgi:hypothetical protein